MNSLNYADAALRSFSSAMVYRYHYNEAINSGLDEAQAEATAFDAMDQAVYRYSQPTMTGQKSIREVHGNQWQKLFMFFQSDQRLKTSLYFNAAQDLMQGRNKAPGNSQNHCRSCHGSLRNAKAAARASSSMTPRPRAMSGRHE